MVPNTAGPASSLKQKNAKSSIPKSYLHRAFSPIEPESVPDMGSYYYNEFRHRVQEISAHRQGNIVGSATHLFFNTIVRGSVAKVVKKGPMARKTGMEIAQYQPIKQNMRSVRELERNPRKHSARLALVSSLLNSERSYTLEESRCIMMQVAVPLGMGYCVPTMVKLITQAHRTFQENLADFYQERVKILEKSDARGGKYPVPDNHDPQQPSSHLCF